ncbi:MAG: DUF1684 domain-containing protein [Actinomycetota bacterium]
MDSGALVRFRSDRDEFFRSHYASPLPDDDLDAFTGLDYFPPDPAMVFSGRFSGADDSRVQITSSVGTTSAYHQMGVLHIDIVGSMYDFIVLDDGDGNPFVAFGDATNGAATYAGGRYVSVDVAEDGSASIDFDLASNPYCVYDEEFVCPLPPLENRMSIPIEAGEMMYHKPQAANS